MIKDFSVRNRMICRGHEFQSRILGLPVYMFLHLRYECIVRKASTRGFARFWDSYDHQCARRVLCTKVCDTDTWLCEREQVFVLLNNCVCGFSSYFNDSRSATITRFENENSYKYRKISCKFEILSYHLHSYVLPLYLSSLNDNLFLMKRQFT